MAYGKKYFKRQHKRRKYGKKGKKQVFRALKPYGIKPDPIPRALHTRLRFTDVFTLYSNAVSPGVTGDSYAFRLNSIYDPRWTGVGTTVVGWSNFNSLYRRYIVKGAKIEVTFSDPDNDGTTVFCTLNQDNSMLNEDEKGVMEKSLTYSSELNNTGSQKKTFKFYVTPWSLEGLTKLEWSANKTGHSALMNANPANDIYFRVAVSAKVPETSIKCSIRIIYYTELYDRIQLQSSTFV